MSECFLSSAGYIKSTTTKNKNVSGINEKKKIEDLGFKIKKIV